MKRIVLNAIATIPAFLVAIVAACASTPAPVQTEPQKHFAADATYLGDMLLCRDKGTYPTLTQSEACLSATRLRWRRLPDGGADGTFADGGAR